MLAMKQRITPIGTQAHEWFMFHGAKYGYRAANKIALERWTNVYDGDLGIALSDTYTSKIFFEQFSKLHAKLFDGVRHDSGDPIEFTRRAIKFYKEVGINPATKNIIFSDGLNIDKVLKIEQQIKDWPIMRSYGIGTNLTNDIGVKPLNIVVKMVRCTTDKWNNWWETIKLSDIPGKHTGEITEIHRCKKELEIL
jgi:nicotinate phosphoribosyltransferase